MSTHGLEFSPIRSTFKALSHPYRRCMLEIAALDPATLSQMLDYLPVTSQTASYHLKVLRDTGMLLSPIRWGGGTTVTYEPSGARLEQLHRYIDSCLMPQWKLEQRSRLVYHYDQGELEACKAALRVIDEKRGTTPWPVRPRNQERLAPAASVLGLMAE